MRKCCPKAKSTGPEGRQSLMFLMETRETIPEKRLYLPSIIILFCLLSKAKDRVRRLFKHPPLRCDVWPVRQPRCEVSTYIAPDRRSTMLLRLSLFYGSLMLKFLTKMLHRQTCIETKMKTCELEESAWENLQGAESTNMHGGEDGKFDDIESEVSALENFQDEASTNIERILRLSFLM